MGNLGRYQEIVVLAKRYGGVDPLLEHVGRAAVEQAAPRLKRLAVEQAAPRLKRAGARRAAPGIIGMTLFAGAGLLLGAAEVESRIKQTRDRRQVVRPDAQLSEDDLRPAAEHSADEPDHNDVNQLPVDQGLVSRDDASFPDDSPTAS